MPIPIKATIGSCDSPIYKGNEYCQQNLPISEPSAAEAILQGLGQAISGDSIVKFGRQFIRNIKIFTTTGTSVHAIDLDRQVPKDAIWLIQRLHFISPSSNTVNTWAWLAMPPATKTRFSSVTGGLATIQEHVEGAIILRAGDTADDIILSTTQFERKLDDVLLTIPEGFFIRFIANIGGVAGGRVVLNCYFSELLISDLEFQAPGLISNEFTQKNPAAIPQFTKTNGNGNGNGLGSCFICPRCGQNHNERRQ